MTKLQILYPILAVTLLLASCTADDNTTFVPNEAQRLSVTITDGGYTSATTDDTSATSATRATENGYTTEFTEGDACGLFVVRSGQMIYSNEKLTAEKDAVTGDLVWKPEEGTTLFGGLSDEHYYLYYPYQASMDGKTAALTGNAPTDAEFFAPLIASWQPQEDQSTYDNYTKSDLMTAKGTAAKGANNTLRLSFAMTHRMTLAVIEMPATTYKFENTTDIPDFTTPVAASFTGNNQPFRNTDGCYRFLYNSTTSPSLAGSYDNEQKEFSFNPSATAGSYKRYKVDGAATTVKKCMMQPGDFYCRDAEGNGYVIPQEASSALSQHQCIGIVYYLDDITGDNSGLLDTKFPNGTHGIVMSLWDIDENGEPKDGNGIMTWTYGDSESVYDWIKNNNSVLEAIGAIEIPDIQETDSYSGYANTCAIRAYNEHLSPDDNRGVKPLYALDAFSMKEAYKAPSNSSGWYWPSCEELKVMFLGQGNSKGTSGRDLLDGQIGKLPLKDTSKPEQPANAIKLGIAERWSSTEYNRQAEIAWNINSNGEAGKYPKYDEFMGYRVRPVLAF